jgi:D-3-phosphoglycerate dehydrogenase
MKIIIADLFSTAQIESLRSMGCDILYNDKLNGESLKQALAQFLPRILVVRSTKVTVDHFNACPQLEAVVRAGSGIKK